MGMSEHAAAGVERYLCVGADEVRTGMNRGVQGIVDEVTARGSETDQECLHYVMHEEAGSNIRRFQGGLMRDCDEHGVLLPSRRTAEGQGMRLADFVRSPTATKANLEEAHVVGVRLYTMAAFRTINDYLRDQDRFKRGASFTSQCALSDAGLDLMSRMLTLNPAHRISAKEALSHAYFAEEPPPKPHHLMPTFPSTHSSKARR